MDAAIVSVYPEYPYMKKLSIGIIAHVDAGKTTLTESMLYLTGMIRSQGRVDAGDAYLDTETLEKRRGVTIYSKQAVIDLPAAHSLNMSGDDVRITLIDTPGHADFIGETERSLSVLDLAILLVSAPDGVTDSLKRLKQMLEDRRVPYVVYVNKTDMCDESRLSQLSGILRRDADAGIIPLTPDHIEDIASLSDDLIEKYLETSAVSDGDITHLIYSGRFHPVIYGSALRNDGTDDLLKLITRHMPDVRYRDELSARVFKIAYEDGHKLSFIKVLGGTISVRDSLPDERLEGQKVTQIRCYSGGNYEARDKAEPGDVVTLCGLEDTFTGMGIGAEPDEIEPVNRPVLRYDMILPADVPVRSFIPKLRELAAQDPLLGLDGDSGSPKQGGQITLSSHNSVSISVMGEFQLEILAQTIEERYGVRVSFSPGQIIYKETILDPVIGFGHFEPLRHYAEVQLLLEPLPEGSGIEIATDLSVNELGINWQKTVLSTLAKELPAGVLTCSQLTDLRITLIGGRSHTKHTESNDFREAARRAVRQALMKTECALLEPYYTYSISLPSANIGKAMNDINLMNGTSSIDSQDEEMSVITGEAPAGRIYNYQSELTGYTSGQGRISLSFSGYKQCTDEDTETIVEDISYDPDTDPVNLSGSVFIDHGAGYYVPWYECESMMHVPSREAEYIFGETETEDEILEREAQMAERIAISRAHRRTGELSDKLYAMGTDEIDEILDRTSHANAGSRRGRTKRVYHQKRVITSKSAGGDDKYSKRESKKRPRYLLVDGYNIIHAWDELKALLSGGMYEMDGAKYRLLDILSEYRVLKDTEIIAVFDAYKVKGHITEKIDYLGVHVVYTKEAETADQYIARFTVLNAGDMDITVATSDSLVQLIILGENAKLMSARELEEDVRRFRENAGFNT